MSRNNSLGFTLIEVLVVVVLIGLIAGMTVPMVAQAMQLSAMSNARHAVGTAIRAARYTAVSKNKTVRVRFNCPSASTFRVVEVVGSGGVDSASNRCAETAYPYPDGNAAAVPDVDGPVLRLPAGVAFGASQDIEIDSAGRVTPLAGCPSCTPTTGSATVSVTNGMDTKTIAITANGQISQ